MRKETITKRFDWQINSCPEMCIIVSLLYRLMLSEGSSKIYTLLLHLWGNVELFLLLSIYQLHNDPSSRPRSSLHNFSHHTQPHSIILLNSQRQRTNQVAWNTKSSHYVFGRRQGWKSRQFCDRMLKAISGFHSLTLP